MSHSIIGGNFGGRVGSGSRVMKVVGSGVGVSVAAAARKERAESARREVRERIVWRQIGGACWKGKIFFFSRWAVE